MLLLYSYSFFVSLLTTFQRTHPQNVQEIALDANSLYGVAMGMKLPYGNLKLSNDIQTTDDVMKYEDNDIWYLLEVDLHYPKHLHDHHKDYPLAPEIMHVTESMVSDVSKEICKCYNNGKM